MMLWMKHSLDSLSPLKMVLYFLASSPLSYIGWDTRLSSSTLWASGPSAGRSPIWLSWRRPIVQLLSHVRLFVTPWTAALQTSLSFTVSQSLLRLMFIESLVLSNQLILCCPLLLLPSIFPSIRVFSNEAALCIKWPKYWTFSFSMKGVSQYLCWHAVNYWTEIILGSISLEDKSLESFGRAFLLLPAYP